MVNYELIAGGEKNQNYFCYLSAKVLNGVGIMS